MSLISLLSEKYGSEEVSKLQDLIQRNLNQKTGKVEKLIWQVKPQIMETLGNAGDVIKDYARSIGLNNNLLEKTGGDDVHPVLAGIILMAIFMGMLAFNAVIEHLGLDDLFKPPDSRPPSSTRSAFDSVPADLRPVRKPKPVHKPAVNPGTGMHGKKLYTTDGRIFDQKEVYPGGDCLYESFQLGIQHIVDGNPLTTGMTPTGQTKNMLANNRTFLIESLRGGYVDHVKKERIENKSMTDFSYVDTFFLDWTASQQDFMLMKTQYFPRDRGFTEVLHRSLSQYLPILDPDNQYKTSKPKQQTDHILGLMQAQLLPANLGDSNKKLVHVVLEGNVKKLPIAKTDVESKFKAWVFFNEKNVDSLPFSFGDGNTIQFLSKLFQIRIVVYRTNGIEVLDTKKTLPSNQQHIFDGKPTIYLLWSGNHYDLLVPATRRGGSSFLRKELGGLKDIIERHHGKTGALKSLVEGLYPSVIGALRVSGGAELPIIQKINDQNIGVSGGGEWSIYHILGFVSVALALGVASKDAIREYLDPWWVLTHEDSNNSTEL